MTSCVENEKMPHAQPVIHSRMAQNFAGAGLKIATDTAGTLGGRSFSLARREIGSGQRESARGLTEKMSHWYYSDPASHCGASGWILFRQASAERTGPFELQKVENALSVEHATSVDVVSLERWAPGQSLLGTVCSWAESPRNSVLLGTVCFQATTPTSQKR
jgi:hypothetical protein